ncbi:unnamed protein product [Cylindrotheca closterium]|uniref:DNA polymerase kappa n=1 Tax=Cylindrotheca closterium TaxID=2856 RepID=A0AAD2FF40_9STRA|nr:unnamed protein product [Cylindrotheca closterium]
MKSLPSPTKAMPKSHSLQKLKLTATKTTTNKNLPSLSQDASALIISASDKAGMDGIDRSKIDAIILRESGNSLYIQQQKRRDAKVNERIAELQTKKQELLLTRSRLPSNPALDAQMQSWQASCPCRATKVVVDMDMFYMACELLTKPHLDQHPACVGKGMVLTSNYKARQFGVRSAMAGFVADKLVEELSHGTQRLIHVPSNFALYQEKAKEVVAVLKEYDPHLKSYSLDEAYLDLGPYLALHLQHYSCKKENENENEEIDGWKKSDAGDLGNGVLSALPDELHHWIRDQLTGSAVKAGGAANDSDMDIKKDKDAQQKEGEEEASSRAMDDEMQQENDMEELNEADSSGDQDLDGDPKDMNVKDTKRPHQYQNYMKMLKKYSVETCNRAIQSIVHHMRALVQIRTGGLTCSAGIAPHSGLAKMASDINKPNGQLLVDPHKVLEFLHPLPVRKVPGIGRVTQKILQHVFQVETVEDLYEQRALVQKLFKNASANYLLKACVGHIGTSSSTSSDGGSFKSFGANSEEIEEDDHQKGISRERTFRPEANYQKLQEKLDSIADMLSNDMVRKKVKAHTITVKVKLNTFDVWSRAKSLDRNVYIQDADELKVVANELFASIKAELAVKQAKSMKKKGEVHDDINYNTSGIGKSSSSSSKDASFVLCCRLLGIRCYSLEHQDALPQQKPMDKFLTRTDMASAFSSVKQGHIQDDPEGNDEREATQMPRNDKHNGKSGDAPSPENPMKVTQESYTCPLCNSVIVGDNDVLNRHIDTCLNASTVRQVVREVTQSTQEETMTTDPKKKASQKQKLTDFW